MTNAAGSIPRVVFLSGLMALMRFAHAGVSCPSNLSTGTAYTNPITDTITCDSGLNIKGTLDNYGLMNGAGAYVIFGTLNNHGRMTTIGGLAVGSSNTSTLVNHPEGVIDISSWFHVYGRKAGALLNYGTINFIQGYTGLGIYQTNNFINYGLIRIDHNVEDEAGNASYPIYNYGEINISPRGALRLNSGYFQKGGRTLVDGLLSAPAGISITEGGVLGGNGTIESTSVRGRDTIISPGSSENPVSIIGSLHLSGYLVMGSGSIDIDVYGTRSDQVSIDRLCAFNYSQINVIYRGGPLKHGVTYDIAKIAYDDQCGIQDRINLGKLPYGWSWHFTSVWDQTGAVIYRVSVD